MYGRSSVQDENACLPVQKGRKISRVPLGSKDRRKPLLQKSQSSLNTLDRPAKPLLSKSNLVLGTTDVKEWNRAASAVEQPTQENIVATEVEVPHHNLYENRQASDTDLGSPAIEKGQNNTTFLKLRSQQREPVVETLDSARLAPGPIYQQFTDSIPKPYAEPKPPLGTTLRDTYTSRTKQLDAINIIDRDTNRSNVDPVKKVPQIPRSVIVPQELIDDPSSVETIPHRPQFQPALSNDVFDIPGGESRLQMTDDDIDLDDPRNLAFDERDADSIGMSVDELNDLLDM